MSQAVISSSIRPLVHIVDDDESLLRATAWMLDGTGFESRTYLSANDFLAAFDQDRPCCAVIDVRMQEMDGLELQTILAKQAPEVPVIIITAHGDVPMAVEAVKNGALDFIEKPFDNADLRRAISRASEQAIANVKAKRRRDEARVALEGLTKREREVFELVADGHTNKAIAHRLNIAIKTVEVHRSRVMEKLRVTTLAEVIELSKAVASGSPKLGQPQHSASIARATRSVDKPSLVEEPATLIK